MPNIVKSNGEIIEGNDLSLNPKDHYFHQGKCYGNCIIGPLSN